MSLNAHSTLLYVGRKYLIQISSVVLVSYEYNVELYVTQ